MRAQKTAPLQNYQPRFGLLDTAFRDDGRLDFCRAHNISVGVYSVLGRGLLAPRLKHGDEYPAWDSRHQSNRGPDFEKKLRVHAELQKVAARHAKSVTHLAIAWVLSHPGVTFAIMGGGIPVYFVWIAWRSRSGAARCAPTPGIPCGAMKGAARCAPTPAPLHRNPVPLVV
jgi:predicted oxidoreductase